MYRVLEYTKEYECVVIAMMQEFHEDSLSEYGNAFCWESAKLTLRHLEQNQTCHILLLFKDNKPIGVTCGYIAPSVWNYKTLEFIEIVWFVKKEFRSRGLMLYKRLLEICDENSVEYMRMAFMENSGSDKIKKFYLRQGFKIAEVYAVKKLRG